MHDPRSDPSGYGTCGPECAKAFENPTGRAVLSRDQAVTVADRMRLPRVHKQSFAHHRQVKHFSSGASCLIEPLRRPMRSGWGSMGRALVNRAERGPK